MHPFTHRTNKVTLSTRKPPLPTGTSSHSVTRAAVQCLVGRCRRHKDLGTASQGGPSREAQEGDAKTTGEAKGPPWTWSGDNMSDTCSGRSDRRTSEVLQSDEDKFAPLCREFFIGWQERYGWLREHWNLDAVDEVPQMATSLDVKLNHLKREIGFLLDQDASLFKQLFELQEEMEELKEKLECECCYSSDDSSDTSSIRSELPASPGETSPYSTLSYSTSDNKPQPRRSLVHHTSFVRQRVSYPPNSRNRFSRAKGRSNHHSQGSYDSGIHTPDHEIFV